MESGEALVFRRPDPGWLLRPVTDVPVRILWIHMQDNPAMAMFDFLQLKFGKIQRFPWNSRVVQLGRQLVRLVNAQSHRSAHFWSEKLFLWLSAWWQSAQHHQRSDWNFLPLTTLKPAHLISGPPQTIKDFASRMGYSRSYLASKLSHQWLRSPGVVLREVRLNEAAKLLRTTKLNISEVGARAGYSSPSGFGRAFMQQFQQSPRTYRHTHR
ncbi:MAG: helix-turn-helix transcriptional regulator [Phycisphaerae bacterium]